MLERRTITFSGRVQGVGFRMTAVQLARDLDLAGTVQNSPDGSVELTVQGETAQIDALISRLREHFGSFIRTMTGTTVPPLPGMAPGLRIIV